MDNAREKIDKVKGTTREIALLYAKQMKLLRELALAVERDEGLTPAYTLDDTYIAEITVSVNVRAKTAKDASEKIKNDPRFVGMFELHDAKLVLRQGFVRR